MRILLRLLLLTTALATANAYDNCDMLIPMIGWDPIAANESFPIPAFPAPTYAHGRLGEGASSYGPRGIPPRVCTWTFQAVGDCSPQLVTTGYKRGDVDCGHQHLLIGDEHTEHRICGFTKPPATFVSDSGRDRLLFLTHFQRNGDHETVSSVLSGVVICSERGVSGSTCAQVQLGGTFGQNTCPCPESGVCVANVTLMLGSTTFDSTLLSCTAPGGNVCQLSTTGSQSFVSANQTCVAPLPPVPNTTGHPTSQIVRLACPSAGSCTITQGIELNSKPAQGESWVCNTFGFSPDTLICSAHFLVCFDIVPK